MTATPDKTLWKKTAAELTEGYARCEFSPAEAVDSVLCRIDEVNPLLNAVITLDRAGARAAASASEARMRAASMLGPIDGVPISVKDSVLVGGLKAVWGSPIYANFVPSIDELVIARLRAAGAIILGKTNCPEFTLQGYTDNLPFGVTRNPWNLDLTPGGSSGGAAAAVAAGLGPVGIGTDGGGSIRRPSAYTGLVGLKPSRGRVPRVGGFPAILPDLETVGPMARAVSDVVEFMKVIGQHDVRDPASVMFRDRTFAVEDAKRCRVLYVPCFGDAPIDPEITRNVAAAAKGLADLGHYVEEGDAPFDVGEVEGAWPAISRVGLAWHLASHEPWRGRIGAALEQMAISGSQFPATAYFAAQDVARRLESRLNLFFESFDLIMTPSIAALPWRAEEPFPTTIAGQAVGPRGHAVFTGFVNIAGCCGINLPCEPSPSGLPIGFQLVGTRGRDGLLCAIAAQYEAAWPWNERWPTLQTRAA